MKEEVILKYQPNSNMRMLCVKMEDVFGIFIKMKNVFKLPYMTSSDQN